MKKPIRITLAINNDSGPIYDDAFRESIINGVNKFTRKNLFTRLVKYLKQKFKRTEKNNYMANLYTRVKLTEYENLLRKAEDAKGAAKQLLLARSKIVFLQLKESLSHYN